MGDLDAMLDAREERFARARAAAVGLLKKHGIGVPSDPPRSVCQFFEVGLGWIPIVDEAFGKMIAAGWDPRNLAQVKQKFCELVVYAGPLNDGARAALDEARRRAAVSCEDCGRPHALRVPRIGRALCDECEKEPGS